MTQASHHQKGNGFIMKKSIALMALACAGAAPMLAGCTYAVSHGITDQGTAREVVFPKAEDTSGVPEGVFPNVENLRKIGKGVTKDDLYHLVGRPHFSETHGAREWDYLFKFRDVPDGPVTVCQYKVIFDKDMKGQSFYWMPEGCAARVNGAVPAPRAEVVHLQADALFPLGKGGAADLNAKGRTELDALAADVVAHRPQAHVTVTGHTDRLGQAAANQRLSLQRAETVRQHLIAKGVPADHIVAEGKGSSQPVSHCDRSLKGAALVSCLAPDRRVDVTITQS